LPGPPPDCASIGGGAAWTGSTESAALVEDPAVSDGDLHRAAVAAAAVIRAMRRKR
jgi:hypothetical protein